MAGLAIIPCFGSQPGVQVSAIVQQADGYWAAALPTGGYVSVQADGSIKGSATVGAWEKAGGQNNQPTPDGGTLPTYLTYSQGPNAPVYQFFVSPVVPNV